MTDARHGTPSGLTTGLATFLIIRKWEEGIMSITITPLRHEFAGEVSGIDCTRPLSADAVRTIRDGMEMSRCCWLSARAVR